jgi:hypothetical protein
MRKIPARRAERKRGWTPRQCRHRHRRVKPHEPNKAKSQTPWLTIIVHDTPKPKGWLSILGPILRGTIHAPAHAVQIVWENHEPPTERRCSKK